MKRRGLSPNSVTRTVKKAGECNLSDLQGGYGGYGSGGGYRKRCDPNLSSITTTVKRDVDTETISRNTAAPRRERANWIL